MPLLEVDNVSKRFAAPGGVFARKGAPVLAVDEVSFALDEGGKLGVVGESGCGKTTLGRLIVGLYQPDGGRVLIDGIDPQQVDAEQARACRRQAQMIWQDNAGALDPRLRVATSLTEPLVVQNKVGDKQQRADLAAMWLDKVGLDASLARRRPHELSGGQRQRVGIARALAPAPRLLIADEPVASLDVSVQTQILRLLADLVDETGVALMFISHDLRVVRALTDQVLVLYRGRAVEMGPTASVHGNPLHPYTKALMAAAPALHPNQRRTRADQREATMRLVGESGCVYAPRCDLADDHCRRERPAWRQLDDGRRLACHRVD